MRMFLKKEHYFWTYWRKSHIFSSLNTTSSIVFKWTGNTFVLDLFLSDGRKSERELKRGKGIEWRDVTTLSCDLTGWLPWCKSREKHYNLVYSITTHADCNSMNLIYQLQLVIPLLTHEWTQFHHHSIEPRSVSCHSHPIPPGLLVSYTNCQIPPLTTFAANL